VERYSTILAYKAQFIGSTQGDFTMQILHEAYQKNKVWMIIFKGKGLP
jgi:hypothetical protein